MTEQTVPATPVVESPDATVEEPQKRFRFTRKQMTIFGATTVAAAGLIYLKVKSSANKALGETDADSNTESETPDSV